MLTHTCKCLGGGFAEHGMCFDTDEKPFRPQNFEKTNGNGGHAVNESCRATICGVFCDSQPRFCTEGDTRRRFSVSYRFKIVAIFEIKRACFQGEPVFSSNSSPELLKFLKDAYEKIVVFG